MGGELAYDRAAKNYAPRKRMSLVRYAKEAVEVAVSIESRHGRTFGGQRHLGAGNPLITETPLPRGWREP